MIYSIRPSSSHLASWSRRSRGPADIVHVKLTRKAPFTLAHAEQQAGETSYAHCDTSQDTFRDPPIFLWDESSCGAHRA
jgi:hypothetical protein